MDTITAATVQNGYALAAIVITALTIAVVFLFRYIQTLWGRINDLQEKRFQDSLDARAQYESVMRGFSQTIELLYNKLKGQ